MGMFSGLQSSRIYPLVTTSLEIPQEEDILQSKMTTSEFKQIKEVAAVPVEMTHRVMGNLRSRAEQCKL
jgi:hypothetical protein